MDDPADPSAPDLQSGPSSAGPETMAQDEPAGSGGRGEPAGSGGTAEPAGPASHWRLHRSIRNRKLKGVAGGVAAAADIDTTLVRLLFAVAAFSGWGIVAYIVLAVVLQDETIEDPCRPLPREQRRMLRIGLAVAAAVAVGRLFDGWFFSGGDNIGLPFLLIAVGAAVLWARRDQRPAGSTGWAGPTSPPPGGPGVGDAWSDPLGPAPATAPWPAAAPPLGTGIDWRSTGHDLLRLAAAFVAVGAFLALLGGTFLVVVGAVPMRLPFLPAAIGVAGLLALVVAVVRRARPAGLFVSGGALVVAAVLAAGLASFPGGAGNRLVVVGPDAPLLDRYEQSAGRLVLDLGQLSLPPGSERGVVAEVGTGELTVIVPSALATHVKAEVGAGSTTLFSRSQGGAGVEATANHPGGEGAGRLNLDLQVGVGQIKVEVAAEPTFEVTCTVPVQAKGDGTDEVTCPHPARLQGAAMACSVALEDPEGVRAAGRAFCRLEGNRPPEIGLFAASCAVPAASDVARCDPLPRSLLAELDQLRAAGAQPVLPPGGPAPPAAPTTVAPPAPRPAAVDSPLVCGPADAAGVRTCTTTPASSTSTTAPVTYRCTEDPSTRKLSCAPA